MGKNKTKTKTFAETMQSAGLEIRYCATLLNRFSPSNHRGWTVQSADEFLLEYDWLMEVSKACAHLPSSEAIPSICL